MKLVATYKDWGHSLAFITKTSIFPGGEVFASLIDFDAEDCTLVTIYAHLTSSDKVMELLMVTDALRRVIGTTPIRLVMPYVPYARQDRVCNPGEALSIKVFCDLINAQGYQSVTILDPHSDVAGALLNNVILVDQSAPVDSVLRDPVFAGGVTLVSPDAGASKKVLKLAKNFNIKDVVFADKVRNTLTGEIVATAIRGPIPENKPILVVDDICDGGRTFIELAKVLSANTYVPLYLYVTHGIFSKGVKPLLEHYSRIFTTDDWTNSYHPDVTVIPLKGIA